MKTKTKTGRLYRKRLMSAQKNVHVTVGVQRVERASDGVYTSY